jgi:hypothetical protein
MSPRQATRTITKAPVSEEALPQPVGQGKRPEVGQFRLQVDRQTKAAFLTYAAAEEMGLAIKREHPVVQVGVYDTDTGTNTLIELPTV